MKYLLTITAVVEAVTGVALVAAPSLLVSVLLGNTLEGNAAMIVARISGLALVTLGIACWQSRNNINASAIVQAMLFYNITIAALLVYCIFVENFSGLRLGPVFILHTGLAVWCVRSLQK